MTLLKKPSAWVPIAFSAIVIVMLWSIFLSQHGAIVREADEGTAAHMFQILMGLQIPFIAFFALSWVPQKPREALQVLALQVVAGIVAAAPVFILHL